jgi:hypothetical protein
VDEAEDLEQVLQLVVDVEVEDRLAQVQEGKRM